MRARRPTPSSCWRAARVGAGQRGTQPALRRRVCTRPPSHCLHPTCCHSWPQAIASGLAARQQPDNSLCTRPCGVTRPPSSPLPSTPTPHSPHPTPIVPAVVCHVDFALSSTASRAQLHALPDELQPPRVPRRVKCEAGSVVGELDFFLQRPRRWERRRAAPAAAGPCSAALVPSPLAGRACHAGASRIPLVLERRLPPKTPPPPLPLEHSPPVAASSTSAPSLRPCSFSAVVGAAGSAWRISRRAFESMAERDPATLNLLQQMVLRSTSLSAAHALEALDRVSHTL